MEANCEHLKKILWMYIQLTSTVCRYVATSKGIVEYKIDLMRRRYFPSIKVR